MPRYRCNPQPGEATPSSEPFPWLWSTSGWCVPSWSLPVRSRPPISSEWRLCRPLSPEHRLECRKIEPKPPPLSPFVKACPYQVPPPGLQGLKIHYRGISQQSLPSVGIAYSLLHLASLCPNLRIPCYASSETKQH